jgi:hypothetical protein
MPTITILGTPIEYPNTGAAPVNSEAQIQFAQLVEAALSGLISTGDVSKQSFALNASHNSASNVTLTGLSFSVAVVRAAFIRYSVYRQTTDPTTAYESGEMTIVYNAANPVTQKWEVQQERVGDASISFSIDDNGQFSFSTTSIGTSNHTGLVSFVAQSLAQS